MSSFQFNNLGHSLDVCVFAHIKRRIPSVRFTPSFILSIEPKTLLFWAEFAPFHHTICRFVAIAWLIRNGVAPHYPMPCIKHEQGSLFVIHFLHCVEQCWAQEKEGGGGFLWIQWALILVAHANMGENLVTNFVLSKMFAFTIMRRALYDQINLFKQIMRARGWIRNA